MPVQIFYPDKQLQDYISYYYSIDEVFEGTSFSTRKIPDGSIELTFHFRSPFYQSDGGGTKLITQRCLLQGQIQQMVELSAKDHISFITVKFKPNGLYPFVRESMKQFTDNVTTGSDIWGGEIALLEEQMNEKQDIQERIKVIEKFLLRRLNRQYDFENISNCVRLVLHKKGILKVDELAYSAHLSLRQLERKFRENIGLSPSQFTRIIRMHNAVKDIGHSRLSELCYEYEYTDQSHFIKEIKFFTGVTPKKINTGKGCFAHTAFL
ncbi:MAG: helix-turn-helix transcriptional regulator [Chitinophagaceae bacterium]|nr:helix-turn-helix transcriptional regulator [Chitinophagaceae bacterium]